MKKTKVGIRFLNGAIEAPKLATDGSACFDVCANHDLRLLIGATSKVFTGLAFELPRGYELLVRSRSGLAARGIVVANSPGTLDSDYRGELVVLLLNRGSRTYDIRRGERIAQIAIRETVAVEFIQHSFSLTERGEAGLGSTGI